MLRAGEHQQRITVRRGVLDSGRRYPSPRPNWPSFSRSSTDLTYDLKLRIWRGDSSGGDLVDYTVPVDLLVYQMNLHFTPSSENKNL